MDFIIHYIWFVSTYGSGAPWAALSIVCIHKPVIVLLFLFYRNLVIEISITGTRTIPRGRIWSCELQKLLPNVWHGPRCNIIRAFIMHPFVGSFSVTIQSVSIYIVNRSEQIDNRRTYTYSNSLNPLLSEIRPIRGCVWKTPSGCIRNIRIWDPDTLKLRFDHRDLSRGAILDIKCYLPTEIEQCVQT